MFNDAPAPEIQINVKGASIMPLYTLETNDVNNALVGPNELKLQISITTEKTVLELEQAIAEKSDMGADRQLLIYSGLFPPFSVLVSWY